MNRNNRNRRRTMLLALGQAALLLGLTMARTEIPVVDAGETLFFAWIDNFRSFFNLPPDTENLNPYVFVNSSRDKRLRTEPDGGRTVETDYDQLGRFLTVLAQRPDSVKFVFCDLFVDESVRLPDSLRKAVETLKAANKVLFASRQDGSRSDGVMTTNGSIPTALSVYDELNQGLVHYPLVSDSTANNSTTLWRPTAPLALYNRVDRASAAPISIDQERWPSFRWPWFRWGGEYHIRQPIVNQYIQNEDVGGSNGQVYFPKHNLYELLRHNQLGDSLGAFGLAHKVIVIADVDPESLDDKHRTTVNDRTYGVLVILNTWEMVRRGATRLSLGWLVMMFGLLFVASVVTLYRNGFADYSANTLRRRGGWLTPWRSLTSAVLPVVSGLHSRYSTIRRLRSAGRFVGRRWRAFDHGLVGFVTGSSLNEHWQNLFGSLAQLIGWGGLLCLLSYATFGIKIEFLPITLFLFTEGALIRRWRSRQAERARRMNRLKRQQRVELSKNTPS